LRVTFILPALISISSSIVFVNACWPIV
jgi:hypothetical protein